MALPVTSDSAGACREPHLACFQQYSLLRINHLRFWAQDCYLICGGRKQLGEMSDCPCETSHRVHDFKSWGQNHLGINPILYRYRSVGYKCPSGGSLVAILDTTFNVTCFADEEAMWHHFYCHYALLHMHMWWSRSRMRWECAWLWCLKLPS